MQRKAHLYTLGYFLQSLAPTEQNTCIRFDCNLLRSLPMTVKFSCLLTLPNLFLVTHLYMPASSLRTFLILNSDDRPFRCRNFSFLFIRITLSLTYQDIFQADFQVKNLHLRRTVSPTLAT